MWKRREQRRTEEIAQEAETLRAFNEQCMSVIARAIKHTSATSPLSPEHQADLRRSVAPLVANRLGLIVGLNLSARHTITADDVESIFSNLDKVVSEVARSLTPPEGAVSEDQVKVGKNFMMECEAGFKRIHQQMFKETGRGR
jgi:hypothetical protein